MRYVRTVFASGLLLSLMAAGASAQSLLQALTGPAASSDYGAAIDGTGDVDGDGIGDFIVGSPGVAVPFGAFTGAAYVHSGADGSVLLSFHGDSAGQFFGRVVAGIGDVNLDGHADVLVGSHHATPNGLRSGIARVFSGADGALLYEYVGSAPQEELASTLAGVGDANLDGHPDFAIGIAKNGNNGHVHVRSGADGSLLLDLVGDGGWEYFGSALDGAGDVDGDGYADIIVGLPGVTKAIVFSGADGHRLLTFDKPYLQSWKWGSAVAGAGDVNADGHDDLIIGDYGDVKLFQEAGMARVFSGLDGSVLHTFYGMAAYDNFGSDLDGAGDVNGDGYADVVVGAPGAVEPGHTSDTGQISVFSGKDGSYLRHFIPPGVDSGDALGRIVAGIGDVNGDGFDDIGVGQDASFFGSNPNGRIWTYSLRFAVTGVEPAEVVYSKPTTVSILGHGFEPSGAIDVRIDGVPCTEVTWISPERVDCVTPGNGVQNTVVDVTYEQAGQAVPLEDGLALAGTKVFSFFPPQGPVSGHDILVIQGDHFVDDGTTTVKFGTPNTNFYATVLDVIEPNVLIVETPVGVTNLGGTMTVKSSAGTGAISHGYAFLHRWIAPHTGNIAGGDVISVLGDVQMPPANDMTARIGNVPATILSAQPGRVDILVPAVAEATGELLTVWLLSPTFGSQNVAQSFMYTPFVAATSSGNAFDGVNLALSVRSTTPTPQSNLVTLWVIDPMQSPHLFPKTGASASAGGLASSGAGGSFGGSAGATSATASGPARTANPGGPSGTLHGAPLFLLAAHVPVPALASTFKLAFGATSPFLIGTTVWVQGIVTGEGNQHGSFTNPISFVIH